MIISARQARDKHSESSKKGCFSQGYFNGGRVAMTTPTSPYASGGCTGVLATNAGVTLSAAGAWEVGNISISEDELLRTQR